MPRSRKKSSKNFDTFCQGDVWTDTMKFVLNLARRVLWGEWPAAFPVADLVLANPYPKQHTKL